MATYEFGNPFVNDLIYPFTLVDVGFSHCDSEYLVDRVCAPYYAFEFIISGTTYFKINGEIHEAHRHDIAILPKGEQHYIYATDSDPSEKVWFVCDGPLIPNILTAYKFGELEILHTTELIGDFCRIYDISIQKDIPKTELFNICAEIFLEIVQKTSEAQQRSDLLMSDIANRIRFEIDDSPSLNINLDDIVEQCFCTKQYAINIFKKNFGVTPYQYIIKKRVQTAKHLLRDTRFSINEIAKNVGFDNNHYFSSFFKKETSMTPSEYRNMIFKSANDARQQYKDAVAK